MSTNLAPRRRLVIAMLAVAVALTLAACGGDDSSNHDGGTMLPDNGTKMRDGGDTMIDTANS